MTKSVTEIVKAASLLLDETFYPRHSINAQHVADLVNALAAGQTLPPIIADRKSKRVVDGFHRVTAVLQGDENGDIEVEWRDYPSKAAMFLDAIMLNSAHGLKFTRYDMARCLVRAQELKLGVQQIAVALHVTEERAQQIIKIKVAYGPDGKAQAIKGTLIHLAGGKLTRAQIEGNLRAQGLPVMMFTNQLINALDRNLVNWTNEKLVDRLHVLLGKLDEALGKKAA